MSDGRVGERLLGGRYRLDQMIGRGGMAEVWAGLDEVLGRQVAVKLLLPRFAQDPPFIARFKDEARHAASLNHPNVVSVYDTGEHEGLPFIVMELVRGRSLAQALQAGGLTEERGLEVIADVCAALDYAHERGLVHRDVKPGNILLAEDGTVKVTDFGIARAIETDTVTQTAAVLGTAAYLSPEQAQGQHADARSDVYSTGVVLYELLAGEPPFRGDTPVTVAYQHVQEMPRPPRDWNPAVSSSAEAIAFRAMAKNPANRYQSAREMRDDVLRARAGQSVAAPAVMHSDETALLDAVPASRATRTEAAERRRRLIGYVLLGLVTIAAAAALVMYLGSLLADDDAALLAVPDVRNQTFEEARSTLREHGFTAEIEEFVYSDTIEDGRVVTQNPSAGSRKAEGTVIRLAISRGRELVTVPEVIGLERDEALDTLREHGFVVTMGESVSSEEHPEGTVVETDPDPGDLVPAGSRITVILSSGVETVRVPSVVGLVESEAVGALKDEGLQVLTVREFSPDVEEGRVIRQEPEPGKEVETGSEVTIVVSKGEQPAPSPTPEPEPTSEPEPSPTSEPEPSPTDTGIIP